MQPVLHNPKGDAYKKIALTAWYKKLKPLQQKIAEDLHSGPTPIPYCDILKEIAMEEAKTKMAVTVAPPDDFFDRLGYGSGFFDKDDVSDSEDEEATPAQANSFYKEKIVDMLKESKKRKLKELEDSDYESSESEAEVANNPAKQAKRRKYKAMQLGAIATQVFPVKEKREHKFRERLQQGRSSDNKTRPKNRQIYGRPIRLQYAEIGEQMKHTNLEHNPFLRRAFRKSVSVRESIRGRWLG